MTRMPAAERMPLQGGTKPETTRGETGWPTWPLRWRMTASSQLYVGAAILSVIGFLFVAAGLAQGFVQVGSGFGNGVVSVSGLVPWGIAFAGFGVALGFLGAAVKGPSMEWRDVPHEPEPSEDTRSPPLGIRFACPGCGGDVYVNQAVCPACGHRLPSARTPAP